MSLLAHAAPISYRFPLPIWIYVVAGGMAVLASAPAATVAIRGDRERRTRDLLPYVSWVRPVGLALVSILLVWGLAGGLFGRTVQAQEFFENPMTVLTWVDFWVGLGCTAALVGNVWEWISPLNALARALGRIGPPPLAYPEWLGQWPAGALALGWSWLVLIWDPAKQPRTLALLVLGYFALTLAGSAFFGPLAWLRNVELFTVLSRTFARFAPLDARGGEVRARPYGAGLRTDGPLPAGGGAFALTLLATVVFDGFSQTNRYASLESWILGHWQWLGLHTDVLGTLLMLAIVLAFVAAFVLVCGGLGRANRYAPTLVPIAAVYFVAHYFAYLLLAGQQTLGTLVDPFGHSWNPWGLGEYAIWHGLSPAAGVWWVEVLLIVAGHVVAILAAHRVGLRLGERLRRQAPLVGLMVLYTMAGLWVLAQQLDVHA
ncbi:MAG: hypothetical protein ACR2MU_04870 [Gaiellaceae bacterium]